MIVVSDSTILIGLVKIGKLNLLKEIFSYPIFSKTSTSLRPETRGGLGFTGQSHRLYILLLDAEYLEAESQDKAR